MSMKARKTALLIAIALFSTAPALHALEINNAPNRLIPSSPKIGTQPIITGHPQPKNRNSTITLPANRQRLDSGPSASHLMWCKSRYKTYRQSDNSYTSDIGVRKSCASPYQ